MSPFKVMKMHVPKVTSIPKVYEATGKCCYFSIRDCVDPD